MFSLYVAPLLVMTAPAESEKTLFWPLQPFTHRNNHARYSVKNNVLFPGLVFSGSDDAAIYRLNPVSKEHYHESCTTGYGTSCP